MGFFTVYPPPEEAWSWALQVMKGIILSPPQALFNPFLVVEQEKIKE